MVASPSAFCNLLQVFMDADTLAKFVILRVRYLFALLGECFNSVPDFHLAESTPAMKKFFDTLASLGGKDTDPKLVIIGTGDSLLNATDWVSTWATLLTSHTTIDGLVADIQKKFGLPNLSAPPPPKPTEGGKAEKAETSETSEKTEDKETGEQVEKNDTDTQKKEWTLSTINSFTGSGQEVLGDSDDASLLKLDTVSTVFLRRFEVELESLLWKLWRAVPSKVLDESLLIDPSAPAKDMFHVKYPLPHKNLSLPFMGQVTAASDGKASSVFLTSVFGVHFFVQPVSSVCTPAWAVKTVSRHDQAFFELTTEKYVVACVVEDDFPNQQKRSSDTIPFGLFVMDDNKAEEEKLFDGDEHLYISEADT